MDSPYTERRRQEFRGPAKSSDYNKRVEQNYKDLALLYNKARVSEAELDDLFSRMSKDQLSLSRELNDLIARVAALEAGSTYRTFQGQSTIVKGGVLGYTIPKEEELEYDPIHSFFTLPRASTSGNASKLLATDANGDEFIPPSFETRVDGNDSSADTSAAFIDSTDPKYAVFSKPGLIWERNVVRDASVVGGAELNLYVRIPTELQTTNETNAIVIHPFPYFGTTLKDISVTSAVEPSLDEGDGYTTLNSSSYYEDETDAEGWVAPGGWTSGDDAITNCGPKKFYFPAKQVTAIRITLVQPDYYYEGGKYIYSYGATQLDVRKESFLSSGKAMIRIDAENSSGTPTTINSIDSLQPQIYNIDPVLWSDAFSYRVIWDDNGTPVESPVANSESVWIEITLNEVAGTTPVLSGFTLQYS